MAYQNINTIAKITALDYKKELAGDFNNTIPLRKTKYLYVSFQYSILDGIQKFFDLYKKYISNLEFPMKLEILNHHSYLMSTI